MANRTVPANESVAAVVHSFTEAELALVEMTGAVAKFRTASEQLATSHADLDAATDASRAIALQMESVVALLGATASALRAVDPDRLWTHLDADVARADELEGRRSADHAEALRTATLAIRLGAVTAFIAGAVGVLVVLFGLGMLGP